MIHESPSGCTLCVVITPKSSKNQVVGIGPDYDYNALKTTPTPFIDKLFKEYPNASLKASGRDVGLPDGLMGNSEVGHLNIGAGRVVHQDIERIENDIQGGEFKNNKYINELYELVKQNDSVLHLFGLFSDGGVHSSDTQLEAFIKRAIEYGVKKIALHLLFDGRDVPPRSGLEFFKKFSQKNNYPELVYSTVVGRFWAMDRDKRWDRVEKAFRAFNLGESEFEEFDNPADAIADAYEKGENDEFIKPRIIKGSPRIKDGDGLFCFNFRADRVRQITMAFNQENFDHFDVSFRPKLEGYLCLTEYKDDFNLPIAYPPIELKNILSDIVSRNGLKQLKIAETEKYPHVTFFFNGGEEKVIDGEERVLIPSPREVSTYDEKPEMSAPEVTEKFLEILEQERFEVMTLNFANGDMVGHTGILEAAQKAVKTLDGCLEKIITKMLDRDGEVLIIADHGNCEEMLDGDGNPHTAHTTNPVPVIFISNDKSIKSIRPGRLADVAPTILKRLNIKPPEEMTGEPLI